MKSQPQKTLTDSILAAMDGTDREIISYLPYILQDSWELGSDPATIVQLIQKHRPNLRELKVLDLGCGKGAVSVRIAQKLGATCLGIDAIPEFIEEATRRSHEFQVARCCSFEAGDIRERVKTLAGFDVIILGSIGPVFGDYHMTLMSLKNCLADHGLIIIDDGYIRDDSDFSHPQLQKRSEICHQIESARMQLLDELISAKDYIKDSDDYFFKIVRKRCAELSRQHPEKRELFENYVRNQVKENDVLENKIVCSAMVIIPLIQFSIDQNNSYFHSVKIKEGVP